MKYIPKALTRFAGKTTLRLAQRGPTLLVVGGVVGLGASGIMAAKASRKIDEPLDNHRKMRVTIEETVYETKKAKQRDLAALYAHSTTEFAKIYGPAISVGVVSAASILYGHRVLQGRHLATLAAYTSLNEQFNAYRGRVRKTLGEDVERGIFEGAHGQWEKDQKTGEEKLVPKWEDVDTSYLRPWFEESNPNHYPDPHGNAGFLTGVQNHMNNILYIRGHVFLNDVLDQLKLPRVKEGQAAGWLHSRVHPEAEGDDYIDFGFQTGRDPHTVAFREGLVDTVQFNFNIDGIIWEHIS